MSSLEEMLIQSGLNLFVQGFLIAGTFILARKSVTTYQKRKDVNDIRNSLIDLFSQINTNYNMCIAALNNFRMLFYIKNHGIEDVEQFRIQNEYEKYYSELSSQRTLLHYKMELYFVPSLDASKRKEIKNCFKSWSSWIGFTRKNIKLSPDDYNPKFEELDSSITDSMRTLMKIILTEKISI